MRSDSTNSHLLTSSSHSNTNCLSTCVSTNRGSILTDTPSVDEFRQWYASARSLGVGQEDLQRIAQMGKAVKENQSIDFSPKDTDAIQEDIAKSNEQIDYAKSIVSDASQFLSKARKTGFTTEDAEGLKAEGKHYQVSFGRSNKQLKITNKESGAKLLAQYDDGQFQVKQANGFDEGDTERWQNLRKVTPERLSELANEKSSQPQSPQPVKSGIEID